MKNNITLQNENHHFTSDDKLKWFGYGEWVEEPDEVEFTYKDHQCKVVRVIEKEPYFGSIGSACIFGGHLCGYVRIPSRHPYYYKRFEDMEVDCHNGLMWGECSDGHWIGFECSHISDYIPSVEKQKLTDRSVLAMAKIFKEFSLFNSSYKNVDYCVGECISMVDQLIMISEVFENEDQKSL